MLTSRREEMDEDWVKRLWDSVNRKEEEDWEVRMVKGSWEHGLKFSAVYYFLEVMKMRKWKGIGKNKDHTGKG